MAEDSSRSTPAAIDASSPPMVVAVEIEGILVKGGHDNDIESPVLSTRPFEKALRLALEALSIRLSLRSMNAPTCHAP